jgi:CBS domain-containing protein
MLVKELMTKEVRTCRDSDTANDVARIMWESDCGCVPVLNSSDFIIGMVTDRDLCMAAYTRGQPLAAIPVATAMAPRVFCCTSDDTVEEAEVIMRRHQVRRLPVYDRTPKLVGILALSDLLHARRSDHPKDSVAVGSVEDTLAGVCRSRKPPSGQSS